LQSPVIQWAFGQADGKGEIYHSRVAEAIEETCAVHWPDFNIPILREKASIATI
jgi:hypothetical protein